MKEAWKYRIKKFQKIMFLIFVKNRSNLGHFREIKIKKPITTIMISMPIPAMANPSKL